MADYYPLIARAVAGLDPNASGESRRALYERARAALIAQLRGVQPPLTEAEITRERLALEEAVRKVEAEAAQRARSESTLRPGVQQQRPPRPTEPPAREGPRRGDVLRESARVASARVARNAPQPPGPTPPPRSPAPRSDLPQYDDRAKRIDPGLRADPPSQNDDLESPAPSPRRPAASLPPAPVRQAPPAGPGTRGFRDVIAESDELGRAASQANRSARRTFSNVASPTPEYDRAEPDMEQRSGYVPYSYDESPDEAEGYQGPGYKAPPSRQRGLPDDRADRSRRGFPLKGALAAGLALLLIGGGILGYQKFGSSLRGLFKAAPATNTQTSTDTGTRPKITDRVNPSDSSQPVAPVAQRAILYEEDSVDPQGKQTVGTVVWRLVQVASGPNQKPDTAIKADIELPDRKVKVSLTIMRNTDPSMPATSHTIEIVYTVSPDFGTTISNVPGVYAKSPDQPRGVPLAATSVKVQDGYFLIGLSNVDVDRQRNIQVLKDRSSLDVPMVYGNGKRAILSIEKGPPGERVFNEAFSAWGQ
ncbi:MAG: hypothetical protein K2W78_03350 [Xanthobacteraceae bacterium]|nr:hypothetical protein [Xanthobacteraceae bacterium]